MNPSSVIFKNQFGEQTRGIILGGTSQFLAQFKVAAADVGGAGLTGLTTSGIYTPNISSVFMHTSQTPATGSPNPAVGLIQVNFLKAHSNLISCDLANMISPLSGTPVNVTSGLTQHAAYVITAVGTTTAAQWQTLGLPVGTVPAIGASFIAITAAAGSGTGVVQASLAAGVGIDHVELIGTPASNTNPSTGGSQLIFGCFKNTVLTQPTDGAVITLLFNMSPNPGPLEP